MSEQAAGAPRADMIQSAVTFLGDPKVQDSPMSQRISFLESKGLTSHEIDVALGQAGHGGAPMVRPGAAYPMMPAYPPIQSRRDWRDWFIMAVVSGTVGYGLIALARRYLLPHLQPPSQGVLEAERDTLAAKYDEVAAHLQQLDETTAAMSRGLNEQQTAVEESVRGVNDMVSESRAREEQRDRDLDAMKTEMEAMREDLSQMIDRARKSQSNGLVDLQGELKSLRSLLTSRGGLANNKEPAAPADTNEAPARPAPSIPAWQLADSADE